MGHRYPRSNEGNRDRDRDDQSRYGRMSESSNYGRSDFRTYDRGEDYFGTNRQGFGDGTDIGSSGTGQSWRNETFRDRDQTNSPPRYGSTSPRYSSQYGGGRDRDWDQGSLGGYGRGSDYEDRGARSDDNRYSDRGPGMYGSYYETSNLGNRSYEDRGSQRGWWDRASDEVSSWFGDEQAERRRRMDETRDFRGRGPKNYTRSDDRIKEDINDRLTDDYQLDASDIDVEVNAGEVVLSGTVNSRYEKRHAEDVAEDVSGVKNVENRIRVSQSTFGSQSSYGTTGLGYSSETDTSAGEHTRTAGSNP